MKKISTSLAGIILLSILSACDSHDSEGTNEPVRSPPVSLVERFSGQLPMVETPDDTPDETTGRTAEFSVASVNGHVRLIREQLPLSSGHGQPAMNTYLYFEDQPVYFQGSATLHDDTAEEPLRLDAYVEFSVEGVLIGAEKRLAGERVPLADEEIAAVMSRGLDLLEASRALQAPDFCDYNKTLRWRGVLATVSVPQRENCAAGRLRIFVQIGKRTLALDAQREGIVADSWIGDFSGNGKAEIIVALTRPGPAAYGELLAFRADGERLQPIEIAPLSAEQRIRYGGQDMFRAHGAQLVRRFPLAGGQDALPGPRWERLRYDWQDRSWREAEPPDRTGWPAAMQGGWLLGQAGQDDQDGELLLEADGGISGRTNCGNFSGGSLWFPDNVVLIRPMAVNRANCPESSAENVPESPLHALSGFWFAEMAGEELRLSSLSGGAELRFTRPETAASESAD